VLRDPAALAMPPAQLAELQGGLLRATAALAHARALHAMAGLEATPPRAYIGASTPHSALPRTPAHSRTPRVSVTALGGLAGAEASAASGSMRMRSSLAEPATPAGSGLRSKLEAAMGSSSTRLSDALRGSPRSSHDKQLCMPGLRPRSLAAPASAAAEQAAKGAAGSRESVAQQQGRQGGERRMIRQDGQSLLKGITREVNRLLGAACQRAEEEEEEELSAEETDIPASVARSGSGGIGRGSLGAQASLPAPHCSEAAASPEGKLATVHCNPLYSKQQQAAAQAAAAVKEGKQEEMVGAKSSKRPGVPGSSECIDAIAEQIAAKLLTKLEARYSTG
jgi:hypothetical protein